MADQLAAGFVGCYGSGVNSTPTLDRLAEKGMRFDRCYATATVCAPNRASILTGRSPVIHGVVTNNLELTCDNPTYAHVLQGAGYKTGGFGKFHHTNMGLPHPENLEYLGFDETAISEDPKWGDYLTWIEKDHSEYYETALSMCWGLPFIEDKLKEENRNAGIKFLKERREESEWELMYSSPLPKELHQTTFITDKAIDFISNSITIRPDQPFCCFVSYVDPHDPYDPPAPYDTMFSPDDMPIPIRASWKEHGNELLEQSQKFCKFDTIADDLSVLKKLRALFHGSIRLIDDQIARIVDYLDENNLSEDTIIVFTTDHGDMMGDHALITKGVKFYDKGIRCPLIVSGKGVNSGISKRLVCSLDFFPSFCDWGDITQENRPPLEGKSFVEECRGVTSKNSWKEVTIESPYVKDGNPVRGIITDDNWRFTIFDSENCGEMFDLNSDPDEQNNLFYNRDFIDKKMELYERITRAFMRSHTVYQYRNLSEIDGKKQLMNDTSWLFDDNVFQFPNKA